MGHEKTKFLCLKRLDSDYNFLMLTRIVLTQLGGHCKYHCGHYNECSIKGADIQIPIWKERALLKFNKDNQ